MKKKKNRTDKGWLLFKLVILRTHNLRIEKKKKLENEREITL